MTDIWLPHTEEFPIPNIEHGHRDATKFVVIHVNDGSTRGTFEWWSEKGHEADGAQLQISRNGRSYQTCPLDTLCWHAGEANGVSVGIEHEGWHTMSREQWLTGPQLHVSADRCAWILHQYGLGAPKLHKNIFPHGFGGNAWGGHPDCPGTYFPWDHYLHLVDYAYYTHWGRHVPGT